jgi:hypothetical protein
MKENYLPKHMRLGGFMRFLRFLFFPICIFAILCLLNYYPEYYEAYTLCY